jgi:hypothetical protein
MKNVHALYLDVRAERLKAEREVMTTALVNFIAYEHYRRNCGKSPKVKDSCSDNIYHARNLLGRHGGIDGLEALETKLSKSKSFNKG